MTDSAYPDLAKVEDWLNAKGYTGEAGACHNAMDKIREQARRIAELQQEVCSLIRRDPDDDKDARIAELEAALKDLLDDWRYMTGIVEDDEEDSLAVRAARDALGEKE